MSHGIAVRSLSRSVAWQRISAGATPLIRIASGHCITTTTSRCAEVKGGNIQRRRLSDRPKVYKPQGTAADRIVEALRNQSEDLRQKQQREPTPTDALELFVKSLQNAGIQIKPSFISLLRETANTELSDDKEITVSVLRKLLDLVEIVNYTEPPSTAWIESRGVSQEQLDCYYIPRAAEELKNSKGMEELNRISESVFDGGEAVGWDDPLKTILCYMVAGDMLEGRSLEEWYDMFKGEEMEFLKKIM